MNNESSTNLPTTKAGTGIALSKAKSLHQLTNRMLGEEKHALLLADHWLDELIAWADENGVCDGVRHKGFEFWCGLPHDKQEILRLTELNLSVNKLATLPDSIGNLSTLTGLYLNDNKLTTLPESLGCLRHLKKIRLDYNPIKKLPPYLSHLENIVTF